MNKLTIPTILVATVMVAGIFAFMPVEQASTVHTTIQLQTVIKSDTDMDATDTIVLTCTQPFSVTSIVFETDNADATDDVSVKFDFDGSGTNWDSVTLSSDFVSFAATPDGEVLDTLDITAPIGGGAGGTVTFTVEAETSDGGNELLRLGFNVISTGTCSA